uniref:Uncharacterized protein n=1 Tax=Anguilla anguilla TaxID=7936 RepID=A0A0E9TQW4_ANGAN
MLTVAIPVVHTKLMYCWVAVNPGFQCEDLFLSIKTVPASGL